MRYSIAVKASKPFKQSSNHRNYQPHPSPPLEKEGTVKGKLKSVASIRPGFVLQ